MSQGPLHLYVDSLFTSPYAMSVFVALREKGLAFETLTLDLDAGQTQAADYAQRSLTQRVPTLVDGDFALSESSAITEYLEEAYPETPVYPTDPQQRARARQVQAWSRTLRARRGDVRLAILALLAEEPMNGYQMIQAMAERTGGGWKPSPGAIYPALAQLDRKSVV